MILGERLRHAWAGLTGRGAVLQMPQLTTGTFLTSLGLNNLDVHPIQDKTDQLDNYAGWVYACASKIAQDLRANPRAIWIRKGKKEEDWVAMDEDLWPSVFLRPNLRQTWGQLIELRNLHKDLTGEAYWHLITNIPGGTVMGIELIQPDWLDGPEYNEQLTEVTSWRVQIPGRNTVTIDARDLILDFYPNPRDPLRGASPVEAFAIAQHLDLYLRAYGLKLIRDGALIGQYVTSESIENNEQADAAEARLMKRYRKAGRIPVFGKGAKLETVGLPLKDLDMLRMLKPSMDQILAVYGVPKSKFGMMDGEGYANAATADKNYQENCLLPRCRTLDEIINERIFPRVLGPVRSRTLYYETESPVEADRDFILKKAEAKFKNGAITVNQFNLEIGDAPIGPDGEVYLIPNAVTVYESLMDAAEAAAVAPPPQNPNPAAVPPTPPPGDNPTTPKKPKIKPDAKPGPKGRDVPVDEMDGMRTFRLDLEGTAERISSRIETLAASRNSVHVRLAKENAKLRRDNATLRFTSEMDRHERSAKSKLRALFTREQKLVRLAVEDNVKALTGGPDVLDVEHRDWIDAAIVSLAVEWGGVLDGIVTAAILAGWKLFQEAVVGAVVPNTHTIEEAAALQSARHAGEIQHTSMKAVRETVRKGLAEGKDMQSILRDVTKLYDDWKGARAEAIALTEVSLGMNWGRFQAAKETQLRLGMVIRRSWIAIDDEKTRPAHAAADSDVNERNRDIGLDEFYDVDGVAMAHPGDWSAPVELVINCRCSEIFRDASED